MALHYLQRCSLHDRLIGPVLLMALCAVLSMAMPSAFAQSENEHLSHHPGGNPPVNDPAAPSSGVPAASAKANEAGVSQTTTPSSPSGMPPGMMESMEKMMKGMMGATRQEIYPSLMNTPTLTPEKRDDVERQAEERIHAGLLLLEVAQTRLSHAIEAGDHDAAEQALQMNREGNAQVSSGVAAHRLLWEKKLPQDVALQWFKQNTGLTPAPAHPQGIFGLSWLHILAMFFLLATAISMVVIYFYKSARAAALLNTLGNPKIGGGPSFAVADTAPGNNPDTKLDGDDKARVIKPAPINPDIVPTKPNAWTGQLLVARIFQETPRVKTFRLIAPAGGTLPFNFLPGQFLTFTVSPHGRAVKRSYTIASSPTHRDFCEVTVKHEEQGLVSSYLNNCVHEGELLQVTGPSGKFTFVGEDADSIVLIGGGVGVTPMMSVIRYLSDRSWPGDIFFIYGCKSDGEVIFREEIEYLQRRYSNLHVTLVASEVSSSDWPYAIGRITTEILANAVPELPLRHIHLCGPKSMMESVKQMLTTLKVPPQQIEVEVFVGKEVTQTSSTPSSISPNREITEVSVTSSEIEDRVPDQLSRPAIATFVRSQQKAPLLPLQTILEAAESVGVNIEYSCRTGTCGICKVKLLSGTVSMDIEDGLEPGDKDNNIILACQSRATADVSIDA